MTDARPKLTFDVSARRVDAHGGVATCKSANIRLDTDLAGSADAFNPAELRGVEVHGGRQDVPPKLEEITYDVVADIDESGARLGGAILAIDSASHGRAHLVEVAVPSRQQSVGHAGLAVS
jgi:hypothetical protein